MEKITLVGKQIDGGFVYEFTDEDGVLIYDTNIIRNPEMAVHTLAHMAHKTWLTRENYGLLAELICGDLGCWK